ncbi:EthD domain-containing protein [Acidicapsa ligni]|uniref:EthD domain-containing protein n=1 Tax=Acidicapsa ligni TaxID=542300 RepID=UPI0021E0986F|nr:EthD domain-containing protein [Acidicapsa ligni]
MKVDILIYRRPDLTHEQFVEHWRDVHAQLFSTQPSVKRHVRRYIQSRTIPDPPSSMLIADYDGVAQLWFDDMEGFHGVFSSKDYTDVIQFDEQKFTDGKRVQFLFSEETSIIG